MKKYAVILALVCAAFVACAEEPTTVTLSGQEKQQVVALLERRQSINLARMEAQADYQAKMSKANDQENTINLDNEKLCFSIKKNHSLNLGTPYRLDEFKGLLVRVGQQ